MDEEAGILLKGGEGYYGKGSSLRPGELLEARLLKCFWVLTVFENSIFRDKSPRLV